MHQDFQVSENKIPLLNNFFSVSDLFKVKQCNIRYNIPLFSHPHTALLPILSRGAQTDGKMEIYSSPMIKEGNKNPITIICTGLWFRGLFVSETLLWRLRVRTEDHHGWRTQYNQGKLIKKKSHTKRGKKLRKWRVLLVAKRRGVTNCASSCPLGPASV